MPYNLKPTLGLFSATILAISMVIGAGMLVLPGLVYKVVGVGAVLSWLGDMILVIPLLWIFVRLGKLYPSAAGVSGFVGAVYPGAKIGVSFVLIGTFCLGIPAVALTGSQYILAGLNIEVTEFYTSIMAFGFLSLAALIVFLGAKFTSSWQNIAIMLLIVIVIILTFNSVNSWQKIDFIIKEEKFFYIWKGMALAFLSYTGWEMFASIAEDMKNPTRDFSRAVIISFILVSILYISVAIAVESIIDINDPLLIRAPFFILLTHTFGDSKLAKIIFIIIVAAITWSNLVGGIMAASRLIFDLGRTTFLGSKLELDYIDKRTGSPQRAIIAIIGSFCIVLLLYGARKLPISTMLNLTGQNFFILYMLCLVVFLNIAKSFFEKIIGISFLILFSGFGIIFGFGLFYPLILFCLPYLFKINY
jgi:amino acid efflux transporter